MKNSRARFKGLVHVIWRRTISVGMVLLILVTSGSLAVAEEQSDPPKEASSNGRAMLNPFELNMIDISDSSTVATQAKASTETNSLMMANAGPTARRRPFREPVRISYRPTIRSHYRPPLVTK
jgi:hypothetical protein